MSSETLLVVTDVPADNYKQDGEFLLPQLTVKLKDEVVFSRGGFQEHLTSPCSNILWRGLRPTAISLSVALGVTLGLFPISGLRILFSAMAAMILQSNCHIPTLLLSSIIACPFQLGSFHYLF
ncbi:hypothetical protein KP509_28G054300 [Ceratopteris richardii]|uniref:Uncharacterized protein n=1 Tax=Ceratopteris richardii TaxID=49495 RepID=A0A8T2RE25_CERRI|nr:hypothetical protein KP509_28G054300 [Ceratopteris richardii]